MTNGPAASASGRSRTLARALVLLAFPALFFTSPPVLRAGDGDPSSRVLVDGEDLIYNVRYGFIDLGQIRITTSNGEVTGATRTYRGKALINSYSKVPFVDLHAVFENVIDAGMYSHHFEARMKEKEAWGSARYEFDYQRHRVIIDVGSADSIIAKSETLQVDAKENDGLSLFFFARDKLLSGQQFNVPTLIKEQKANSFLDFRNERTSVEVDAIDYPVDVVHFDGHLDFVGIFGLTGGFEGWFSNDEARVPIMAKMKVLIGSVTVELMKWNRQGWTPPRGQG